MHNFPVSDVVMNRFCLIQLNTPFFVDLVALLTPFCTLFVAVSISLPIATTAVSPATVTVIYPSHFGISPVTSIE